MPNESESAIDTEATLAVPGVVSVTPRPSGTSVVHLGPAAGWMVPRGIARWERELSFVRRVDMTAKLGRALHATLPHEQIPPKKLPLSFRATQGSPFLPLQPKLVTAAVQEGARVFTVGVDRVSAGFFVFVDGGAREPVRVQGNLVEMLAPTLQRTGATDLTPLQEGLIDRLLAMFTNGVVTELDVELANALPRASRDGTGLEGTYLEVFEVQARALASRSARWAAPARSLAQILTLATRRQQETVEVPLFGEARREVLPQLEVLIGGKTVTLPEMRRWTVKGPPNEELIGIKPGYGAPGVPRPAAPQAPSQVPSQTTPKAPPAGPGSRTPVSEPPPAEAAAPEEAAAKEAVAQPAAEPVSTPPRSTEPAEAPPRPARRAPGVRAALVLLLLLPVAYFVWDSLREPPSKEAPAARPTEPTATPMPQVVPVPPTIIPEASPELQMDEAATDGHVAGEGGADAGGADASTDDVRPDSRSD